MNRPDIYIGLVAAAGTDLGSVKSQLRAQFAAIGYEYEEVRVSQLIADFADFDSRNVPEDERITYLMDAGDAIRQAAGNGGGVASLMLHALFTKRSEDEEDDINKRGFKGNTVFVIDSLKNPSEITILDQCFARNYYTVSVYSPVSHRRERLAKLISKSRKKAISDKYRSVADHIMQQDEGRKPKSLSQDVLGTFPKADFFVESTGNVSEQLKRFVELVFGNPFITPNNDEHFMNLARNASLRSADLSRQVGAVIVDSRGAVISQGYNEVPYPGGGVYYEGRPDAVDNRDYVNSRDPNQSEISEVIKDFVATLRKGGLLMNSNLDDETYTYELLHGEWSSLAADLRVKNLIEFGRIVHAEMNAICEAARLGRSIDGTSLYCTTFPCHGCARHIIAAGIVEVVFIEPYPKSLTKHLYCDEIQTDEDSKVFPSAVRFRPFQGVSPILFRRVFNMRPRKNSDGSTVNWDGRTATPLRAVARILHHERERELRGSIETIRAKFTPPPKVAVAT